MILPLLLVAQQAPAAALPAVVDGLPIGAIPRQVLPAKGCAAYLWSRGPSQALVAMLLPGTLRVSLGGTVTDLPLTAKHSEAGFGLPASADYASDGVTITLALSVSTEDGLKDGARVPDATLTITRPGADVVIAPLAGLVGCAAS